MTAERDALKKRLEALGQNDRSAFAAFWPQRLMSAYERLHTLDGFGDPAVVQACLDLVWSAARGESFDRVRSAACKDGLVDLAPELELRPQLAVASMECVAAVWDALTVAEGGTTSKPIETWDAYVKVVEHFLMNRDHPHALIASNEPDPFGLRHDPLWQESAALLESVLVALEDPQTGPTTKVASLRARAADSEAHSLVASLESLSDRIQRRFEP